MRRLAFWLALAALGAGACECDGGAISTLTPEIEVAPVQLAFGEVPLGATRWLTVTLRNSGSARLTITSVDAMSPFAAENAAGTLEPGASRTAEISFTPASEGPSVGQLVIHSDASGAPTLNVPLSGSGVAGFVEVTPAVIDLSGTTVGDRRGGEIILTHRGITALNGRVVPQLFPRPEHFALSGLTRLAPGPFGAPPRGEARFALEYSPLAAGEDGGRIVFEICGERCGLMVTVVASAVSAALRIEPAFVEFGEVGIAERGASSITLFNDGTMPLEIRDVRASSSEVVASSARPLPQMIGPGSSLALDLEYRPQGARELTAELVISTSDPGLPRAVVGLHGIGVGPRFEVEPEQIDFGVQTRVAEHRRGFLLANAGSSQIEIQRIELSGDSVLTLAGIPGLPLRLGRGESLNPSVVFTPTGDVRAYQGTITVASDDPSRPMVQIPVSAGYAQRACQLTIEPGRLNFGVVVPGSARRRITRITNSGGQSCQIVSGAFRAPLDPVIRWLGPSLPIDLAPGQSFDATFEYRPTVLAESKVSFVFTTADPVLPERVLSLVGSSIGYDDLFVLPPELDFGSLRTGCSVRGRSITVYNAGLFSATVERVTFTSTSSEFATSSLPVGALLEPGQLLTVTLSYEPTAIGEDRGEVEVEFADRPYALYVPVRGVVTNASEVTQSFRQSGLRGVDVLFVIDDSCSMAEEQSALQLSFDSFIRTAALRQVDFRLGITTTTLRGGDLVGPVMTPQTPGLEAAFRQQAGVGVGGSGVEQGLEAMLGALSLAAQGAGFARDLIRADTLKMLILISDEDDQSPAAPVTYFRDLRARFRDDVRTAAVTGQRNGCDANGAIAAPAGRYEEFISLTRGQSLSICTPNWSTTLATLGAAAFGLETRFVLDRDIDTTAPIAVRVNGMLVPNTSWRIDGTRTIVFTTTAPAENSTIEVSYTPAC